ncbi:MAG: hypothetical protein ACTS73_00850 [Arsenophonus sp. NEOnobi-MAG3]
MHEIQWVSHTFNLLQWLTVFLEKEVSGGINTVLLLVPKIGLIYLFLFVLKNSGYIAYVTFIM